MGLHDNDGTKSMNIRSEIKYGNPHYREERKPIIVFKSLYSWSQNWVGMLIRFLEFMAFGQPLHTLLRTGIYPDQEIHSGEVETIANAIVSTASGIGRVHSGLVISPYMNERQFMSGNYATEIRKVIRCKKPSEQYEGGIVIPKQTFYFHFVYEWLPRLLLAAREFDEVTIISGKNPSYVFEYLHLLALPVKVSESHFIEVDEWIVLRSHISLPELSQSILKSAKSSDGIPHRKIFVSREGFSRYIPEKEDFILNNLDVDVEQISLNGMSVVEQIRLFESVSEVHCVHGGALTNILWMKPKTKVFEYFTSDYRHYCYKTMAETLGLQYTERIILELDGRPSMRTVSE
jgi:hypothetical protein